jgi:hypothetical protein
MTGRDSWSCRRAHCRWGRAVREDRNQQRCESEPCSRTYAQWQIAERHQCASLMVPATSLQAGENTRQDASFPPYFRVWRNRPIGRSALDHMRYLFRDFVGLGMGGIKQTHSRRQLCFGHRRMPRFCGAKPSIGSTRGTGSPRSVPSSRRRWMLVEVVLVIHRGVCGVVELRREDGSWFCRT